MMSFSNPEISIAINNKERKSKIASITNTCPALAFSHTDVSYGTEISGGNSLTSRTFIITLTLLVNSGLPINDF